MRAAVRLLPLALLLLVAAGVQVSAAFKPVVFVHGFFFGHLERGSPHDFDNTTTYIQKYHKGTKVFALDVDTGVFSSKQLWMQAQDMIREIEKIRAANADLFKDGFHLVGHSQGSLVARAILELTEFKVSSFISLNGVHGGFYGPVFGYNESDITKISYNRLAQWALSAANMWRTPHDPKLYREKNKFLPVLDGDFDGPSDLGTRETRKRNFMRVPQIHLIASPDDEAILPWYSGVWDFYDTDCKTRVPLEQSDVYLNGQLGLAALINEGRLHRYEVRGINHEDLLHQEVPFVKYVLNLLD